MSRSATCENPHGERLISQKGLSETETFLKMKRVPFYRKRTVLKKSLTVPKSSGRFFPQLFSKLTSISQDENDRRPSLELGNCFLQPKISQKKRILRETFHQKNYFGESRSAEKH